jgi:hypothetical protein
MRHHSTQLQIFKAQTYLQEHRAELEVMKLADATRAINTACATAVSANTVKNWSIMFSITFAKSYNKGMNKTNCRIKTLANAIAELYEDVGSKQHPGVAKILEDLNGGDK